MTPCEKNYILEPSFKERAESLQAEFFYINLKNYFNILNDPSNYIQNNTGIKEELTGEALQGKNPKKKPPLKRYNRRLKNIIKD